MGSFVAGLDATVVNVALPSISHDLGGGLAGQQWVSNAYLLMLGSLILVAGSLADLYGERRVFSIGVGGFGVVSLVCAFAPSIGVLIAGRALQGVFGALLTPSALAVIIATFPAQERGTAIGTWTAWSGISFVIGPLVGGWLIDVASWRWIFAINVPFVLATLGLVAVAIPRPAARDKDVHLDLVGAALCVLGLAGPVLALIRQPEVGWGSPEVWAVGLAGLALFGAFLVWESRCTRPMLPLVLFKRRNFSFGNLETFVMYGGMGTLFFFLTLFLQQVAGYSALQAGVATIPTTLIMFTFSRRVGRLADRYGPRFFMGGGPLIAAAGLALMLRVDADLNYWTDLFPALLVFSSGLVLTVAPLTATVLSDADESNAGIASAVNNAIARVANLVCVAALGAVVAAQFNASLDAKMPGRDTPAVAEARLQTLARVPGVPAVEQASVEAFHFGVGVAATMVALGGVLGLVGIRNPRRDVRCADCAEGAQAVHTPLSRAPAR